MAFAIDPLQKDQQPGAPGIAAIAPPSISGAPGSASAGAKATPGTSSAPAQPFTNLQAYLSANAPQIQKQADTISSGLSGQYGQDMSAIGSGTQAFGDQVAAGYTPENPALVSSATANPAAFVKDPNNVAAFKSQINDVYTGPTNFEGTEGYKSLNNQVTQDVANADLVNTPAGLQTYLRNTAGGNPTKGDNLLDSVLIEQSPAAIQQVQKAASPFSKLPQYLSDQVTAADQVSAAAPVAATKAATDAQAGITKTGDTLGATLSDQQAKNQKTYTDFVNSRKALSESVGNGTLTPEQEASLGLTPGQFESLGVTNSYGNKLPGFIPLNLSKYFSASTDQAAPPTQESSATPDQIAEIQALGQLGGSSYTPPFDASGAVSPWALPTGKPGSFDFTSARSAGLKNLGDIYNADKANAPGLINADPALMTQLQSVLEYLNNPVDPSTYAPSVLPPGVRLAPGNQVDQNLNRKPGQGFHTGGI